MLHQTCTGSAAALERPRMLTKQPHQYRGAPVRANERGQSIEQAPSDSRRQLLLGRSGFLSVLCTARTARSTCTSLLLSLTSSVLCCCYAGLCCLALPQIQQQPAFSKPNLFDLPACNNFKQAGSIAYCEIKQGSGESPLAGDLIEVDYTARAVATGKVYDGSRSFKFTVGNDEVCSAEQLQQQSLLGQR